MREYASARRYVGFTGRESLSKTQNLVFLVFDASNDAKPPESAVDSANRGRDDGVEVLCFCGICKHEVLCEPSDLPLGKKPILFVPE
jgi:hypothetical protein